MAVPGWYDENSRRAYPFVSRVASLPTEAIVDLGFDVDAGGFSDPAPATFYLASISRASGTLAFRFEATGATGAPTALTFARDEADPPWTTSEASATADDPDGGTATWSGFLATGPLGPLLDAIPDGQSLAFGPTCEVEPCLVRTLSGAYVRAILPMNFERLLATDPGTPAPPFHPGIVPAGPALSGPITVRDGYNVAIRQDDAEAALTATAAVGAGAGAACAEVPRFAGETPPAGSSLLSGGPTCGECISSINGQVGATIRLVGGSGVSVSTDPANPHRILIDLTTSSASNCVGKPIATAWAVAIPPSVQEG